VRPWSRSRMSPSLGRVSRVADAQERVARGSAVRGRKPRGWRKRSESQPKCSRKAGGALAGWRRHLSWEKEAARSGSGVGESLSNDLALVWGIPYELRRIEHGSPQEI
jgi:hypothetical protein